ncbi:hypothetical protein GCM10010124_16610 [Pilimelia terevasa]|uniref:LamG-like jellyroll fold domain-containing protein n=1 Tax=Pilimelia terevasa TaxID=53372 RepID=A0A8J3BPV0_9ACTN|nr:LamG domain-containing protein [Pilimelia terevasa]GGK24748.1 hypothetical protein GCM10010124_16610 [Pilimelia terevasa]
MHRKRRDAGHSRRRVLTRTPRVPWLPTLLLGLLGLGLLVTGTASSALSSNTRADGSTLAAASSFDYAPAGVSYGPSFYHRADDAQSAAGTSSAADSSGNARTGTYGGRTDGPSTWWKLDEGAGGAGTVTADSSGAAAPGTLTGANAGWNASGKYGSAFAVTSGAGYVAADTRIRTDNSFSIGAWLYPTTDHSGAAVAQTGSASSAFMIKREAANDRWQFLTTAADTAAPATVAIFSDNSSAPVNTWTHVLAVYDDPADKLYLYVNGNAQGTPVTATADWQAGTNLLAGASRWNSAVADQWVGRIDEVRAFSRALGAAEAATFAPTFPPPSSPLARWEFDNNCTDSSGNGRACTNGGGGYTTTRHLGTHAYSAPGNNAAYYEGGVIDTSASFSVAAWVYPTALGASDRAAVSQSNANGVNFQLGYEGNGSYPASSSRVGGTTGWSFQMAVSASTGAARKVVNTGTNSAQLNTWTHLLGTFDATTDTLRLYVNGVLANSLTEAFTAWDSRNHSVFSCIVVPIETAYTSVGRTGYRTFCGDTWGDFFTGPVDQTYLYQRVLDSSEIAQLMVDPSAFTGPPYEMAAGQAGALTGSSQSSSTAVALSGSAGAYNPTQYTNPGPFTAECLVRVTGGSGGAVLGFAASTTGAADSNSDRVLYVDSAGKLAFVAQPGGVEKRIVSAGAVNDGAWHHVVGSLGPAGLRLYLDGVLVGTDAATTAKNYAGYWRVGGQNLTGYTAAPTSHYLTGTVDEVAVYPRQLTDNEVLAHHIARS